MKDFRFKRHWGPSPRYDLVRKYKRPNNDFIKIAGPCSMESVSQLENIALKIRDETTHLRSGVFKAGTYEGQTFGWIDKELIKQFHDIANRNKLKNIIEILDYRDIDWICDYADCFQVGARQTQNYTLLKEVGKSGKPVFLKRNMGMTVDEFLGAANYILNAGCKELYLIERGSSTYHSDVRWTPTVHVIPSIKSICDVPVIWDASHATGRRDIVDKICLAGISAGADGYLIETHSDPEKSISDADQAISIEDYKKLCLKIERVRNAIK
jgi:3-deoxy-7-phosphoheptulonate synthase